MTPLATHGLSNVIYLHRLCVGMMMNEYSNDLKGMMDSDGKGGSLLVHKMAASSITALLEISGQATAPGVTRSLEDGLLELELLKFIITLCTFMGNGLLEDEMGVLDSCMKVPGMDRLASVLLHRWIHAEERLPRVWVEEDDDVCTQESALSSMTKTFVSLPWQATSLLTRRPDEASVQSQSNLYPSTDILCFAILIFYYHESSAGSKKAVPNVFRESVKTGQDHTMISFTMFIDTIGSRLSSSESSALLLYTILQGNRSFHTYCMVCECVCVCVLGSFDSSSQCSCMYVCRLEPMWTPSSCRFFSY